MLHPHIFRLVFVDLSFMHCNRYAKGFLPSISLDGQALTPWQRKEEARIAKERKELAWRRDHAYDDVMTEENLEANSNENRDENFLDDFM